MTEKNIYENPFLTKKPQKSAKTLFSAFLRSQPTSIFTTFIHYFADLLSLRNYMITNKMYNRWKRKPK